jgi:C_GCAxxG_C_C family probable redox protein
MNRKRRIEEARQRARDNFSQGLNCAECVVEALFEVINTGLPPGAWALATGFGGGIGLYGDTCGALAGAVLAVSAIHGRSVLPDGEDRDHTIAKSREQLYERPGLYRIFNQIPNRFRERFDYTLCRELAAKWRTDWLCREHALYCREIITEAAGWAAELMLLDEKGVASLTFGTNVERIDDRPGAC